ncbi:DUF4435 domain-containing protein [Enterobacter sp. C4G1]|uniref:DUF4435 domain-containing protein n=1 Tax=Enterobacter sp. C4G1 TaxID=3458724 RepID=UPI00406931A7
MTNEITLEPKKLIIPKGESNQEEELFSFNSFVIVGANGSGKSRLGAWLEMQGPQKNIVHRVAAQRSLVFPKDSSPIGLDAATQAFLWAQVPSNWDINTFENNKDSLKLQRKYGGTIIDSVTSPVNDYRDLLTLLLSESFANLQRSEEEYYSNNNPVIIEKTKIRILKEIWEELLPHRKMYFNASEVKLRSSNSSNDSSNDSYNATNMSDGERVIFYLIGQVLCAAQKSIIIVDEPEIHLHKGIQAKLWQLLEINRNDCAFVYLTHDLDFAASREGAKQIFMKGFDGKGFDWEIIPDNEGLPEAMLLELIGSRKPVLFIEGDEGSKDSEIFKLTYPKFFVKPVGGCSNVILATKAFRRLHPLHQLECNGIIDRDYLIEGQITAYEKNGIYALKVAEVENLFITPQLIKAVAERLLLNKDETLKKVREYVINRFRSDIEEHAMNIAKHMITIHFGRFSSDTKDPDTLQFYYQEYIKSLDPKDIYIQAKKEAELLIENEDYIGILKVYNKKELLGSISFLFDIKGIDATYLDKLREMIRRSLIDVHQELSEFLPSIN